MFARRSSQSDTFTTSCWCYWANPQCDCVYLEIESVPINRNSYISTSRIAKWELSMQFIWKVLLGLILLFFNVVYYSIYYFNLYLIFAGVFLDFQNVQNNLTCICLSGLVYNKLQWQSEWQKWVGSVVRWPHAWVTLPTIFPWHFPLVKSQFFSAVSLSAGLSVRSGNMSKSYLHFFSFRFSMSRRICSHLPAVA